MPETSVVVRTFNEEKHIANLLRAIRKQEYTDYEIVLVDSGSTDNTVSIAAPECDTILTIESWNFTFGHSLNVGCEASRGKYIVIVSAHAYPADAGWLGSLLAPFRDEKVAMVYGKHVGAAVTKFPERRDFERYFSNASALRRYGNNANSAIRKSFWETQHFDERLTGLEDIHWIKMMGKQGYHAVYEPKAPVLHIHDETPSKVFERYRREAVAAKIMGLANPPHAGTSIMAFFRNVFMDSVAAFPWMTLKKILEILQFRFNQWRGSRHGWLAEIPPHLLHATKPMPDNEAVVITNQRAASLVPVSTPELKPGEVLIRVAYVGICKTDLEVFEGSLGYYQKGQAKYPIVPGHEFSGTIERVGSNAGHNFSLGDPVVGECILSCKKCRFCLEMSPAACVNRKEVGVVNHDGAYSRFVVLPHTSVHHVPKGISLRDACLTEPLAVVLRGLSRLKWKERNGPLAVIGAGPIGNMTAQVLRALGKQDITVFDKNTERLKELQSIVETRPSLEGLEMFDTIVEATGVRSVLHQVLSTSSSGARILLLGFPYGTMDFNFEDIVAHEKSVIGSVGSSSDDFRAALKVLPKINTAALTNVVLPLSQYESAWKLHQSGKHLKIFLEPTTLV